MSVCLRSTTLQLVSTLKRVFVASSSLPLLLAVFYHSTTVYEDTMESCVFLCCSIPYSNIDHYNGLDGTSFCALLGVWCEKYTHNFQIYLVCMLYCVSIDVFILLCLVPYHNSWVNCGLHIGASTRNWRSARRWKMPISWRCVERGNSTSDSCAAYSKYVTIQYKTIQDNTIQDNTRQYKTIQDNTRQYNTRQDKTIQYIQYNTIQYKTTPACSDELGLK